MINNMEYDTNIFRFSIKSLPAESIYDFNLDNDIQTLKRKRKSVVTLVVKAILQQGSWRK